MEVVGNIDLIKNSIKERYDKEVKSIEKDALEQIKELNRQAKEKIDAQTAKINAETDSESKKLYSKILSENRLKAKREYEEAREDYIRQIFSEALKKAKKIAHSSQYVDYVKKLMPKENGKIIADSSYFKKYLGVVSVDKKIIGVKVQGKNVTYDLSLDGIIASKRDKLRHAISKVLFKNG